MLEFWNDTYYENDIDAITNIWQPAVITSWVDEMYFYGLDAELFTVRISAYFVPPSDGQYTFYVKADDEGALYFSPDKTKVLKVIKRR